MPPAATPATTAATTAEAESPPEDRTQDTVAKAQIVPRTAAITALAAVTSSDMITGSSVVRGIAGCFAAATTEFDSHLDEVGVGKNVEIGPVETGKL